MADDWSGKTFEMRRGVTLTGWDIEKDGTPVATLVCDCATATQLVFDDLRATGGVHEVAYTCDGCSTTHWLTVGNLGPRDAG